MDLKAGNSRYIEKYKETEDFFEKTLVFEVNLKKNEVPMEDLTPAVQNLSHELV